MALALPAQPAYQNVSSTDLRYFGKTFLKA